MKIILTTLVLASTRLLAQSPQAYQWFTATGKPVSFDKVVKASLPADAVFFGELHDDPIAHWMQNLLAQELFAKYGTQLKLGAEMFERDQQKAMNRFLSGEWNEKTLQDSSKMWPNFSSDYLPLLVYARDKKIPYIATNIPRMYASRVFKKGLSSLDSISETEKKWICPLPFPMDTTLSQYKELIQMGKDMHGNGLDFALSQAIKDATMAYSMLENWQEGTHFLHLNGSYHSDFHQSIVWYLQQAKPNAKVITISTVTQDNLKKLESDYLQKADFILVVPNGMTRTM